VYGVVAAIEKATQLQILKNLDMCTENSNTKQPCTIDSVMLSAFGYRFKITSKQNNKVIGTGFFKTSRKFSEKEQIDFFHEYTNGGYLGKESFINVDVFETEA